MKITNRHGLPEAIVAAVRNDDYDAGNSDYTVTQLVSPPRIVALRRQHEDELVEDAADRLWLLQGKAMHQVLAAAGEDALTEERLFIECNGLRISGQFDNLVVSDLGQDSYRLTDYKLTSVWAVKGGVKPEWEAQLNLYALLLHLHSFRVAELQIVALLRDWSRPQAQREADYPQAGVVVLPVTNQGLEWQGLFLQERLRLHEAAKGALPLCSADDRWQRPDSWAVVKPGAQRATRVFPAALEAEALAKNLSPRDWERYIEYRPGLSVRCESYCAARDFCDQWKGKGGDDGKP